MVLFVCLIFEYYELCFNIGVMGIFLLGANIHHFVINPGTVNHHGESMNCFSR